MATNTSTARKVLPQHDDPLKGAVVMVTSPSQFYSCIKDTAKPLTCVNVSIANATCASFLPLYKELSKANHHAHFLYIDIDKLEGGMNSIPEIADVGQTPSFQIYKAGKKIKEFGGPFNHIENVLRDSVVTLISSKKKKDELHPADQPTHDICTPGTVFTIDKEEDYQRVLFLPKVLVVVCFYNHEKISQDMKAIVSEVAPNYPRALFCLVDAIKHKSDIRACIGILRLPLIRLYKDVEKLKEFQGATRDYLESLVKQYYNKF
eukprot:TRINITY_DN4846_c0_g1_i4.p1 TRINITY_DN4846_c0_g1~~TRINITY_DN4846_c0_g1_i4.p1  ORF type:complete len:263 (+),score=71.64 TRINITY_DN4846_c0_g1_i4:586-1374(+)